MKDAKLQIHPEKTIFHTQRIHFLRYIIMDKEIKMNSNKVKAIRKWPTLMLAKGILSFLGFIEFYCKFVKNYSKITALFTKMTRKDIVFTSGLKKHKTFDTLKEQFTTEPILIMFDSTKPIMLKIDASNLALRAIISQQGLDGKWHPVAFYSQKLTVPEQNYKIHNKELLAIVDLMKHWRVYLEGSRHQVQIYSDHKNLVYFTTTKELN